ncbi:MAG TPA: hypothetical protein VGF75_07045 [Candidatus Saccharimonadales bacterium]|jgi:hypothetical protein
MSAIVGPIALYNNPPIEPQYFQPWSFAISALQRGVTTTITLVVPAITELHYVIGQLVRLLIPPSFGCRQLNGQTGYVIAIPASNQITIDLNSAAADPYTSSSARTQASIVAVGDNNTGIISSTGRVVPTTQIPGSFINISPN